MLYLLRKRSFAALTWTQFLGAFNDNAFKQVVLLLLVATTPLPWMAESSLAENYGQALPSALFALPFVMFGALTGSLADRMSKSRIIQAANVLEILVMGLALLAFQIESYGLLLATVFMMGGQSAIFGPSKYGSILEIVEQKHVSAANAVIQVTTMMAVLLGILFAGELLEASDGRLWIPGLVFLGFATVGFLLSLRIRYLAPRDPDRRLDWNVAAELRRHWQAMEGNRTLVLSVIASGAFYLVAALLILVVNGYGKHLGLETAATARLNGMVIIGIALGSVVAGRLSRDHIEAGLVPIGLFGMAACLLVVQLAPDSMNLLRASLVGVGISAGFFSIPIRALIQSLPRAERRGSVLGLSEVIDFVGILSAAGCYYLFEKQLGLSPPGMFLVIAVALLVMMGVSLLYTAEFAVRLGLFLIVHSVYRLRVKNLERIPARGGALLVSNHVSFIDALLIGAAIPRPVRFLMYRAFFDVPFVGWFARKMGAMPVSSEDSRREKIEALRAAAALAASGEIVGIFAEGEITRTGTMLPFARGMERIAKKAGVPILPVALDRVWGSIFSFDRGKVFWKRPHRIPYPVDVLVGEPRPSDTPAWSIRNDIQELIADHRSTRSGPRGSLAYRFLRVARLHARRIAIVDSTGVELTYRRLLAATIAMRGLLRKKLGPAPNVAVMLPPSAGGAIVNITLAMLGKTSVNLNYTMSNEALAGPLEQAEVRWILTSRRFLAVLKRDSPLPEDRTLFVEDLAHEISPWSKIRAGLITFLPGAFIARYGSPHRSAGETATIIFSSGSTGTPKGVRLSHANILSNVQGVLQVLSVGPGDALLGVLPFFHCFGYTVTLWGTLLGGAKAVYYPNPLDAKRVGELCGEERVTIVVATPTFYRGYLKRCTKEQMQHVRIAVSGAEKLPSNLAEAWEKKFETKLMEGYGCSELSPVVSLNVPDVGIAGERQVGHKPGTIGRPLPGVAVRIVGLETREVLGPDEDGLLEVKGPTVMQGYLAMPRETEEVMRDGWYSTGDVARLDRDGFLAITDRLSRFSKIGGEMVPHGRIEEVLRGIVDERMERDDPSGRRDEDGEPRLALAVTSVPDPRKGEQLVVLHTGLPCTVEELLASASKRGLPNLFLPRATNFVTVDEIPKLGSGKMDLCELRRLALAATATS